MKMKNIEIEDTLVIIIITIIGIVLTGIYQPVLSPLIATVGIIFYMFSR